MTDYYNVDDIKAKQKKARAREIAEAQAGYRGTDADVSGVKEPFKARKRAYENPKYCNRKVQQRRNG